VLCRAEARTTFFFLLGPLLAPLAALGFLPLAAQVVRKPWRRALQTAAAVLAAAAVAGLSHLRSLGVAETNGPLASTAALADTLDAHPVYLLLAAILAATAVALPWARSRGAVALAALAAVVTALAIVGAGGTDAWPIVVCTWITCGLLAAEPPLRRRLTHRPKAGPSRAFHPSKCYALPGDPDTLPGESTAAQGRERMGTVPAEA